MSAQLTELAKKLRNNPTDTEKKLWYFLRNKQLKGLKFRRQHPIGKYIVDFVCLEKRLIVELDSGQHLENKKEDQEREQWLKERGYAVIRFWNDDALQKTAAVLEEIGKIINTPSPSPSLQREGKILSCRKVLSRSFYAHPTLQVAEDLIGKILVYKDMSGRITETEAYIGEDDLACHASRGRTPRTEIMYGQSGHAYIYLIYGMYHCLNIVTEKAGSPAAVLIRGIEPLKGVEQMIKNRAAGRRREYIFSSSTRGCRSAGEIGLSKCSERKPYIEPRTVPERDEDKTKLSEARPLAVGQSERSFIGGGPGKLCQAFGLTKKQNGLDLCQNPDFYLADDGYRPAEISKNKRIGVDYAKHCRDYLWRFSEKA